MAGGAGIAGNAYIGGNVYAPTFTGNFYGVYSSVAEAQALTASSNFSFPAYFKELDIVIRDLSVTVGSAQVRLSLRAGTTALTHTGISSSILPAGNIAWNVGYMILNTPAAAEFAHYRINIKALSTDGSQNNYLVTGHGYNSSPYAIVIVGNAYVALGSQLDNIQFSASTGAFDLSPKIWIQAIL